MDKKENGTGELGPIEVALDTKPARRWNITATAYRNAAGNGNGEPVWEEVPVTIADMSPINAPDCPQFPVRLRSINFSKPCLRMSLFTAAPVRCW